MKRYASYKDSGIELIGQIPEEWEVLQLKRIVSTPLKYGANEAAELDDRSLPRYIRITDFGANGKLRDKSFRSLPIEKAEGYYIEEGDILFARSGATVGKTFILQDYMGKACFAGYLIKATFDKGQFISKFVYYYTKSIYYQDWKNSIAEQATIQNIGADKYKLLPIPISKNLPEQKAIAKYLDDKTSVIDALITKTEQKIQLLKEQRTAIINQAVTKGLDPNVPMKDSGVEWIGEIPEHWEFSRVASLGRFSKGKGISRGDIVEKGVPCIRYGEIYTLYEFYFEKPQSFITYKLSKECVSVKSGALLFVGDGETKEDIGKCVVYNGTSNIFVGGGINVLTLFKHHNVKFLSYTLNSSFSTFQKARSAKGEIIIHIYSKQLREIQFPLPPISEQKAIAKYLDEKIFEIDSLIQKEETRIMLVKEYRQALISEVVTGKICVLDEIPGA